MFEFLKIIIQIVFVDEINSVFRFKGGLADNDAGAGYSHVGVQRYDEYA